MSNLKFTQEDVERFASYGFEVYKSSNGRYYVRPTVVTTLGRIQEAVKNAGLLGLELTTSMEVLDYKKSWE